MFISKYHSYEVISLLFLTAVIFKSTSSFVQKKLGLTAILNESGKFGLLAVVIQLMINENIIDVRINFLIFFFIFKWNFILFSLFI
jgi:hypothetical protein